MKAGLTLEEMAREITRLNSQKADYQVNTQNLEMEPYGSRLFLHMYDQGRDVVEPLEVNDFAHKQLGSYLHIPAAYYERMATEYPELLAHNVNAWFQRTSASRMVRTLNGTVRAFLSSSYRRIDNIDIARVALPILGQMEDSHFESCQITDTKMYIKVVNTRLQAEVTPGDIVQAGVVISNSEVGDGSVRVQPLVYRLVCRNGMVVNDAQMRKVHKGQANVLDESYVIYSDETLAAEDYAFVKKIQDTIRAAVEEARFSQVVNLMRNATTAQMNTSNVPGVVQLTSKDFHITEDESAGVLQHLIEGKDLTLYGLSNAVTRYSQDVEDYDRASKLESIGYDILSMPHTKWNRINQAA